jgi:hypothetical protein
MKSYWLKQKFLMMYVDDQRIFIADSLLHIFLYSFLNSNSSESQFHSQNLEKTGGQAGKQIT